MKKERIEKAVEIINYAIQNQISVKEASVKCGMSDTYVKNVKALVHDLYEEGELDIDLFQQFDEAYKRYIDNKGFGLKEADDLIETTNKPKDLPPAVEGKQLIFDQVGEKATIDFRTNDQDFQNEENLKDTLPPNQEILKNLSEGDESYPKNHIKTLDELLEYCKVDTDLWKVSHYRVNKWDVTSWQDGYARTIQNFQVKADLIRDNITAKERILGEIFQEMTKNYQAPVLKVLPNVKTQDNENNLFEVTIFDLHLGKLAWGGETGESYDTKIARQRFLTTVATLIKNASGFKYDRILFPIGSDFFNSDTIFNTTTKGTPQDEDLRWQKTFNVGVRLLIDAISLLKQTGVPIDVVNIPGNHDFERSFYLGSYLEAWYNNDLQVKVNNGASPRKYYRFGKVLLGLTHGSEEKESSLPLIMASDIESKPMWSETLFHEWHVGHIHRKRDMKYTVLDKAQMTNEDLGVTVRYLSSLTGTEEWHHKKGFIGAIKAGEGFIWNDEVGMIAHLNANLTIL